MEKLIEMLRDQKGRLVALQIVIVLADGYALGNGIPGQNGLIFVSIVMVGSLFFLQSIRGRFLLVRPFNWFADQVSTDLDTWYLRVIVTALFLVTLTGQINAYTPNTESSWWNPVFTFTWWIALMVLVFVFLILVPAAFWHFRDCLRERIVTKLKKHLEEEPYERDRHCPFCHEPWVAIERRWIIDWNEQVKSIECSMCNNKRDWLTHYRIGEVDQ